MMNRWREWIYFVDGSFEMEDKLRNSMMQKMKGVRDCKIEQSVYTVTYVMC